MEYIKELKKLCIDKDISLAELARRTDQTPQALSNKLSRNDMKISDYEKLLNALGAKLVITFTE